MSIEVIFPPGVDMVTASKKIHQWDYGQKLQIESNDLLSTAEVHFEYNGRKEAPVRVASVANGKMVVSIPDECLEQSEPVTAWVYEIVGNTGKTVKKVTLNIIPRAKPFPAQDVPQSFTDKYTEALTAFREEKEALLNGNVKVSNARNADEAETAKLAERANRASLSDSSTYSNESGMLKFTCSSMAARSVPINQPGVYLAYIYDKSYHLGHNAVHYYTGIIFIPDLSKKTFGAVSGHAERNDAEGSRVQLRYVPSDSGSEGTLDFWFNSDYDWVYEIHALARIGGTPT